ncbi:Nn.00g054510.m01.CDS01 [Neocucurbitaria sp. VM-36]
MANEEQRRAFASYMGSASANNTPGQGQPIPQYPGAVANPGNPYLYTVSFLLRPHSLRNLITEQFPGLGAPPAAPTPPPAAPSSIASHPSYQPGVAQPGYSHGGYGQGGFPQRPPPLGQAATPRNQQHMPLPARPPGYVQVPRNYNAQPPPSPGYHVGWQYTDPMAEQNRRLSGAPAAAMVPASRNTIGNIVESGSKQTNEYYQYQQYGRPPEPPGPSATASQVEEVSVPVMLCHTCSHCGRMRSAGFHRNNPVLPGKPLVSTPCRRCKKKMKTRRHSSFTRIRTCTADEPCNWPGESLRIDIDHNEHRGRQRNREEVYVVRHSPSRPRIRQSSSQTHLGLRVLQQPPRESKTETRVRLSSLSPPCSSRYDEVWPLPDVVREKPSQSGDVFSAPPEPLPNRSSVTAEVWPPPDVVPTHSYRKVERSPSHRRPSSRVIELSPSPPPARTRSTRVAYRSESPGYRHGDRNVSPMHVSVHETRRSEDAEARIMAHPSPYRPVLLDQRGAFRESDENSSNNDPAPRRRFESPNRGILRPRGMSHETNYRRRSNMRDSQQSVHVEVGGPRVQFASDQRSKRQAPGDRGPTRYMGGQRSNSEKYEHYHDYSRHRYIDESPTAPPIQDFERLRIRRYSLSPRRSHQEEIRIDRARRMSPSPPPRRHEDIRLRHVSPPSARSRIPRPPPSPPSPEYPQYSGYCHVSRTRTTERTLSQTPPPKHSKAKERTREDVTDSDSAASGEITEVRSWKGIDENGLPATFIEERRTVRMIEPESNKGGVGDFMPLKEGIASRSWRDV